MLRRALREELLEVALGCKTGETGVLDPERRTEMHADLARQVGMKCPICERGIVGSAACPRQGLSLISS